MAVLPKKCFSSEILIMMMAKLILEEVSPSQSSFSAGVQSSPSVLPGSNVDRSALTSTKLASKRKTYEAEDELNYKRGFSTEKKQRRICEEREPLKRPHSHTAMSSKCESEICHPEKRSKPNGNDRESAATASTSTGASSTVKCRSHNRGKTFNTTQREHQRKIQLRVQRERKIQQRVQRERKIQQRLQRKRKIQQRVQRKRKIQQRVQRERKIQQRLQRKRKIQQRVQRKRKIQQRVPKIWIIGSSYIKRGEWAARQMFGEQFGLDANVHWFGKGGMRWNGVLPRFYAEISTQSPPDILVIHAGGNDLGLISALELSSAMKDELIELHAKFPSMTIIYSCINERQAWRYGNPKYVNKDRKTVNAVMRKAVYSFGGFIIEHPSVRYYDDTMFVPDGVHFSKKGNYVFLSNIRHAIKNTLQNSSHRRQI